VDKLRVLNLILTLYCAVILSAAALNRGGTEDPAEEPAAVQETVFNVDGLTCWAGNNPVLTYDTTDSTAKLTITCQDDVLFHYLPAIERTQ
jgi:predicted 3-demethylubiquinone-9 3-methyltransferase (glyoxalase superfamily)